MRARALDLVRFLALVPASAGICSCGHGSTAGPPSQRDAAADSTQGADSAVASVDGTVNADASVGDSAAASDSRVSRDSAAPSDGPGEGQAPGDSGTSVPDDGSADASDTGPATSDGSTDAGCVPPSAGPVTADVVQHHKNASRDGVFIDSTFTTSVATGLHLDTSFAGTLTGQVYAQPLWVGNGPNGAEAFIVATELNHVTAISGTGSTIWDQTFGAPMVGSPLPCGDIDPLGITGTPYIDATARVIYFDAMNTGPAHMVYAISLDTGATLPGWPVNVNAAVPGFDSSHQNERGALQLVNGILYVPFGGLDGDCDPYHGRVVGIPVANPGSGVQSYTTAAARGGIWGPGSLPSDGAYVYPVTGNTEATTTWGGGEAVLRLSAGPSFSGNPNDYYAPSNWLVLDETDLDLGGANDFLFDMPCAPFPHLAAAAGKDQTLYILNRDNLGGIGGELSKTVVATGQLTGAGAAYHTALGTYIALHVYGQGTGLSCPGGRSGNLVVVKLATGSPPVPTVAWCSAEGGLGSPIVTTTDGYSSVIVWDADNRLHGYDGDTGAVLYDGGLATDQMDLTINYFNTFIETNSRIAVAVQNRLYVFH